VLKRHLLRRVGGRPLSHGIAYGLSMRPEKQFAAASHAVRIAPPFQIHSGRILPARRGGYMSLSSSPSDRRTEPRIDVRMPIRFRPITEPASAEQSAESVNISRHGLCFSTTHPLRIGEEVEIYLRMPRELSQDVVQVRWNARVVHIEPNPPESKIGVGVRLERLSPIAERESWVC
jgi:hypothetical protein